MTEQAPKITREYISFLLKEAVMAKRRYSDCHDATVDIKPAILEAVCALALQAEAMQPRPTHRHIKTGGLYQMIGSGAVQSERPLTDMQAVVIYRAMKDGTLWAREFHEFHDAARFEPLTSLPEPRT